MTDPAGRARELIAHHERRLAEAAAALTNGAHTGYDVSLALFPDVDEPGARRFAVAETLSHLERLVRVGTARRTGAGGRISYTAA